MIRPRAQTRCKFPAVFETRRETFLTAPTAGLNKMSYFRNTNTVNPFDGSAVFRRGLSVKDIFKKMSVRYKQVRILLGDANLRQAIVAPIENPSEGAKYRVGEKLHVRELSGKCRRLRICGVKSGGFSYVYTVLDEDELKAFCLKQARTTADDSEAEDNEKLQSEAALWLKFERHPNLVAADSAFYINGELYILIEYVPGDDLGTLIKQGPIDTESALNYAVHICRAIIHARKIFPGLVHRDIKPANCLITAEGQLKLTDFGLADVYSDEDKIDEIAGKNEKNDSNNSPQSINQRRNFAHRRAGTLPYMAPEILCSGAKPTEQSDIFAFGVTLFEMLTGEKPFRGAAKKKIVRRHQDSSPTKILFESGLPPRLIDLISNCLAIDPAQRPENFAYIENRLSEIYREEFGAEISVETIAEPTEIEIMRRSASFASLYDFDEAERLLENLPDDKKTAETAALKALIFCLEGEKEKASAGISEALKCDSSSAFVRFAAALIARNSGRDTKALSHLEEVVRIDPGNAAALNLKGEILLKRGFVFAAAECFEKSLAEDDFHAEPVENLARLHFENEDFRRALLWAKKALEINPNNKFVLSLAGDACLKLKKYPEAVLLYKKVVNSFSDSDEVRENFVRACAKWWQNERKPFGAQLSEILSESFANPSPQLIRRALELFDATGLDPLALYFLEEFLQSELVAASGDMAEKMNAALRQFFDRRQAKTNGAKLHYTIGKLFYVLENYEACIEVFSSSLKENGPDENCFYYLAACFEIKNDLETAKSFYEKAVRQDRQCELSRSGLRRVNERIKEIKASNDYLPEIEISSVI
jgi:serine/threonine protein kinase